MAEKADMPGDTVSLPPTYAPSEAYTESPPPAYRRDKSTRVQIVKMVCVTLVASALIVGFFILTSNYLASRACVCHKEGHSHKNLHAASFVEIPRTEALVGNKLEDNHLEDEKVEEKVMEEVEANHIDAGDDTALPPVVEDQPPAIPEEEVKALVKEVQEVEEAERELEEVALRVQEEENEEVLQDIMRAQMDHMKKIKLPIDLILGNPALAGRDVNCEVERRQQPLGGGIMTQAIIVTCHDNDDDNNDQQPLSGPILPPPGPRRLGPPLSLIAPIMKMLTAKAASRATAKQLVPISGPRPMPFPAAPLPCPVNGPFPCVMTPVKQTPSVGAPLSGRIPIPHDLPPPPPFNKNPEPQHHIHLPSGPAPVFGPNPRPMLTPVNAPRLPEPQMDDGPRHRMLPFPFRPIVRMSPRMSVSPRMPRLLPSPERKDAPISLASLHRGALPLPPHAQMHKNIVHVMPEAKARALPNPVNLPPLRLLPGRLLAPAPPVSVVKAVRHEGRPVTHMEMQAPPTSPKKDAAPRILDFGPPRVHTVISPAIRRFPPPQFQSPPHPNNEPRPPISRPQDIHIRPIPKDIMTPPKPIAVIPPQNLPIAGHSGPVHPPPPPPPPKFDPEGRTGPVPEINPDAEIIIKPQPEGQSNPQPPRPQEAPRKHHLLVVN